MSAPRPSRPSMRDLLRNKAAMGALAIVLLAVVIIGFRIHAASALRGSTEDATVAIVSVVKPSHGPAIQEIVLPGTVQAWHEAPIYARTNGYLKRWLTGMGTPVKEGDLLAEIDSPEIDSQLRQAQADLITAKANNQLAQSTAKRWAALLKTDSVSKQEADEKQADASAKAALVDAAKANVQRLQDLESFKRVVAPFDGMITSRTTDVGALITSGSTTGQILFRIAQADKLRIYVPVPQNYASAVTPDLMAELHYPDHPGESFTATLYHSAEALDPVTRSLLIEFKVDNQKGELLPGGYVEVHLKIPSDGSISRLPVNTLIFRSEGTQVATVDKDGKALLKSIKTGRDFGNEIEVVSGLEADDQVIINPPDSLTSGEKVKIVVPEEKKDDKK